MNKKTEEIRRAWRKQNEVAKGGRFVDDVDDIGHDPRYAAPVSRFSMAKPAVKTEMVPVAVTIDGEKKTAARVKDGLDRMFQRGSITENAYNAARLFQNEYGRAGYGRCASVNLEGTNGGFMGIEEIYDRSTRSRDYVFYVISLLGGCESVMAKVVCYYLGENSNLEKIACIGGDSKHYWRGILISALYMMEQDYVRMMRGKRRKGRSDDR
jgi:hypothetical protein